MQLDWKQFQTIIMLLLFAFVFLAAFVWRLYLNFGILEKRFDNLHDRLKSYERKDNKPSNDKKPSRELPTSECPGEEDEERMDLNEFFR